VTGNTGGTEARDLIGRNLGNGLPNQVGSVCPTAAEGKTYVVLANPSLLLDDRGSFARNRRRGGMISEERRIHEIRLSANCQAGRGNLGN
jgi:hypothetical protein